MFFARKMVRTVLVLFVIMYMPISPSRECGTKEEGIKKELREEREKAQLNCH